MLYCAFAVIPTLSRHSREGGNPGKKINKNIFSCFCLDSGSPAYAGQASPE